LEAHPDAKVTVFAVWIPMMPGDARSEWDAHVLNDPRVVSLWDGQRIVGNWFAEHGTAGIGSPGYPVWDAYFAYPKDERSLDDPIAAGSEIISHTDALEQRFVPLLER
jgi:hypothetical protein